MNKIYFDNAAATRPLETALERFASVCREDYGNPSSPHEMGLRAEKIISGCKKRLRSSLDAEDIAEVVFTSGATESNNLAIFGYARPYRKKRVICSEAEHPSVLECYKELGNRGYDARFVGVDSNGAVDAEELAALVTGETILVSLHHVNHETGFIQDIEKLGRVIKRANKNALFHIDAAQSFGKLDAPMNGAGADLLSVSAHKMGGVKGVGALVLRKGASIQPLFFGGGQQRGLRPGTENTCGVAAFGAAMEYAGERASENYAEISRLNAFLRKELAAVIPGVFINSPENASPYILNVSFMGAKSEIALRAFESEGVYVSAGSACSSKAKAKAGAVLAAQGFPGERIDSALRLSFSHESSLAEGERFIEITKKIIPALRGIYKKG